MRHGGIIIILMGGQQSQKRDDTLSILKSYSLQRKNSISERQFTAQIFKRLDNDASHTTAGPILVTDTYVLKAFYNLLKDERKGLLLKQKCVDVIEQIFDKPEKAIEYSHRIISADRDKLSRKDFSAFMENCLEQGVETILKRNSYDKVFEKSFRDWMKLNKGEIMKGIEDVFEGNKQGNAQYWTIGDFKRWILDNNHWTLFIEIKSTVYRIPLNIPCLFGVKLVRRA